MANEQALKGQWNQIRGSVKSRWGFLTDDDMTRAEGDADQLIGIIQQRTGESREKIEHDLDQLASECSGGVAEFKERAAAAAAEASHRAREFADRASQAAQNQYSQLQGQYGQLSEQMRAGYADTEQTIRSNPLESIAVAFGTGLIAGVIVGLSFRPRN